MYYCHQQFIHIKIDQIKCSQKYRYDIKIKAINKNSHLKYINSKNYNQFELTKSRASQISNNPALNRHQLKAQMFNTTGNKFGQQPAQNSMFGGQQSQQGQQAQNNTIFGGNNTGLFNKPAQQTGTGGLFNQGQQGTGMFNQGQQQGTNFMNQGQQGQAQGNIVQGGIFNQQQQQGAANLFNQPQSGIMQNQAQGNNLFNRPLGGFNQPVAQNQWMQGGQNQNMINPQQQYMFPVNPIIQSQQLKLQITQFTSQLSLKNLQYIRLDEMNMYRDAKISSLPQNLKNNISLLINNMRDLKGAVDVIKKENDALDRKATDYCQNIQNKLLMYKESLIQNIATSNMLQDVKQEVNMIQKQLKDVLIPMYNAYKEGTSFWVDTPDQFSVTISKKILQKMIELNSKVDQILACHQTQTDSQLTDHQISTVQVLQQLLIYYENVASKVAEFSIYYQQEKAKKFNFKPDILKKIQNKVKEKVDENFRSYDLMMNISDILSQRQRRDKQSATNSFTPPVNVQRQF